MSGDSLNEAGIIELIKELAGVPVPGVEVAIGDDAAAFHFSSPSVLVTTDSVFEGVHFSLEAYGLSDVGWKAAAAGISDIAAMGGQPMCALLSLAFHHAPSSDEVRSLAGGLLEMLESCSCSLIGGDVCRSAGGLALTVTVLGTPSASGPVLRSGAKEGDTIGLTGTVGDSAAGLFILQRNDDELRARYPELAEAHLRPRPRVEAGWRLAAAGVNAMEDISDGLGADLVHVSEMSGLGCEIDEDLVPLSDEVRSFASDVGKDPLVWALSGGEDYELVFTVSPDRFDEACESLCNCGVPATRIGSMKSAGDGCVLLKREGKRFDLRGVGYDHFG